MKHTIVYFLTALIIVSSCKQHEIAQTSFAAVFYRNQHKFNELVEILKQDTSLKYGIVVKASQFNRETQQRLNELEVDEVYMFSWGRNQKQFELKTSWRQQIPICLYYNLLDSINTKVGYYEKDRNTNEIWGLGNHWCLFTEMKLNDAKQ